MAQRAFKYFSIAATGTPQPLIGTTLNQAGGIPAYPQTPITITVVDTSMFQKGDYFLIDVSPNVERGNVYNIISATQMQVTGLVLAHATGVFVYQGAEANSIYVQTKDGNAAAIWIGTSNALTTAGVSAIAKLQPVASGSQPTEFVSSLNGMGNNPTSVGQIWITGTSGDQYLPSFSQV